MRSRNKRGHTEELYKELLEGDQKMAGTAQQIVRYGMWERGGYGCSAIVEAGCGASGLISSIPFLMSIFCTKPGEMFYKCGINACERALQDATKAYTGEGPAHEPAPQNMM